MSDPVILIVDDEEALRRALSLRLEDEDFELLGAENGQKALEIISTKHVDIVVTDLLMPDMGGLELMQKLHEWQMEIPVIAMSGGDVSLEFLDADSLLQNAERYGAFEVIEKPFKAHDLIAVIHKLLAERKQADT